MIRVSIKIQKGVMPVAGLTHEAATVAGALGGAVARICRVVGVSPVDVIHAAREFGTHRIPPRLALPTPAEARSLAVEAQQLSGSLVRALSRVAVRVADAMPGLLRQAPTFPDDWLWVVVSPVEFRDWNREHPQAPLPSAGSVRLPPPQQVRFVRWRQARRDAESAGQDRPTTSPDAPAT